MGRDLKLELMPELVRAAREAAISFRLEYWEGEDNLSFETFSAAKSECRYRKRAYSIQDCIDLLSGKDYGKK